jgi:hypothetical protein
MDYNNVNKILGNKKISLNDLFEISTFLLNEQSKTESAYETHSIYFKYLVENYSGEDIKINKIIKEIIEKKEYKWFGKYILVQYTICDLKISGFFLKIYYNFVVNIGGYYEVEEIPNVLNTIKDKYEYLKFMTQFDQILWNIKSIKTIDIIFEYCNNDINILNYFLSDKIRGITKKIKDKIKNKIQLIEQQENFYKIFGKKDKYAEIEMIYCLNYSDNIFDFLIEYLEGDTISIPLFTLLYNKNKFEILFKFLMTKKLENPQIYFDVVFYNLKNNIINDDKIIIIDKIINIFLDKFDININEENELILFKCKLTESIKFLIDKKKFVPSFACFCEFINNLNSSQINNYNNIYDLFLIEPVMDTLWLEYACLHCNYYIINNIYECNYINPNFKCFENLFQNKRIDDDVRQDFFCRFIDNCKDIILTPQLLYTLGNNKYFDVIEKLLLLKRIHKTQECFNDIFLYCIDSLNDFDNIVKLFIEIYDVDINNGHTYNIFHYNLNKTLNYLINEKNIISSLEHFAILVINNDIGKDLFDKYFSKSEINIRWLELASQYCEKNLILDIVNREIIPDIQCFNSLLKNKIIIKNGNGIDCLLIKFIEISNDIILDEEVLKNINNKFYVIEKFIDEKKIKNVRKCIDIILQNFDNYFKNHFDDLIEKLLQNYKKYFENASINFLFNKNINKSLLYLIQNTNFIPSFDSYSQMIMNNRINHEDFNNYFDKSIMNHEWLELGCRYCDEYIITHILNQKIKPTIKCINQLFDNTYISIEKKSVIFELFLKHGYQMSDDDFIMIAKRKIIFNDSQIKKIISNYNPIARFFDNFITVSEFTNVYNKNFDNNIHYIKFLIKIALYSFDLEKIYLLILNNEICIDLELINIIKNKVTTHLQIKNKIINLCEEKMKIKEEQKKKPKKEIKEEPKKEIKEEPKKEIKEEPKKEFKEEPKKEIKIEPKEEPKKKIKIEPKEEPKKEIKEKKRNYIPDKYNPYA